jgi:type IV pilus assembly protein PilA
MSQSTGAAKPPVSTLAVVALVCSVLCWFALVGFILGIVALVRIKRRQGALGGKTLAILAIVINLALVPTCGGVYAAIAIPNFILFQCRSKQSEARANLKALAAAEELFKAEHEAYTADLAALHWQPAGGERLRYEYLVVNATAQGFRAEARGSGDMAGDLWVITEAGEVEAVADHCTSRD